MAVALGGSGGLGASASTGLAVPAGRVASFPGVLSLASNASRSAEVSKPGTSASRSLRAVAGDMSPGIPPSVYNSSWEIRRPSITCCRVIQPLMSSGVISDRLVVVRLLVDQSPVACAPNTVPRSATMTIIGMTNGLTRIGNLRDLIGQPRPNTIQPGGRETHFQRAVTRAGVHARQATDTVTADGR